MSCSREKRKDMESEMELSSLCKAKRKGETNIIKGSEIDTRGRCHAFTCW